MRLKIIFLLTIILTTAAFAAAQNTDGGLKPSVAVGEVVAIDTGKILLQTKDGAVEVKLSEKTEYKRVPPENPTLKAAVASNFADIGAGDKVAVTGIFSADKKTMPARAVYLMTKADISQKIAKDGERWKTRGLSGKVTAVNQQTKQITVDVRGLSGNTAFVVTPKETAEFVRYAPNSVKYSEAQKSSFADVKIGDSFRAVGDKGADGTTFTAEEILTGAFQTVAGTVKSIDAAKGEITISDIQTKKDVVIAVNPASIVKKFPEEMAQRMAQFQTMRAGGVAPGGQGANGTGGVRPPTPPNGGQGAGFGGGMRGGNIDEMLERFKDITIADLKVGDMIAASSTKSVDPTRITAIKLLAGVEPFLKVPQIANGGNGGGGNRGGGGFSIPGLDGPDGP